MTNIICALLLATASVLVARAQIMPNGGMPLAGAPVPACQQGPDYCTLANVGEYNGCLFFFNTNGIFASPFFPFSSQMTIQQNNGSQQAITPSLLAQLAISPVSGQPDVNGNCPYPKDSLWTVYADGIVPIAKVCTCHAYSAANLGKLPKTFQWYQTNAVNYCNAYQWNYAASPPTIANPTAWASACQAVMQDAQQNYSFQLNNTTICP